MSIQRIRKPLFIALALLLALTALGIARRPAAPATGDNIFTLKAPSFLAVANAEEAAPMAFPADEAGISAYFHSTTSINLADVRSVFRVIEVETADYIIGSVALTGYPESYDVHLYVHRDGWFLAYYLASDPAGKVVDWKSYTGTTIPTVLEKILLQAATTGGVSFPGCTYYDFRYPNATNLMLVAEDNANGNDFQVKLTGTYAYYERSWSMCTNTSWSGGTLRLDGAVVGETGSGWQVASGHLTAVQMLPDTFHTISISSYDRVAYGGLALVYRVP